MTRPADPADVAASSPGTSSWANSVADAIQAILADIYGATNLAIPWTALTGAPAAFVPAVHTHADAAHAGQIAYGVLTGVPSTFAPSAHAHAYSALTGIPSTFVPAVHTHADAAHAGQVSWDVLAGKPSTFAPSVHAHTSGANGGTIAYSALTGAPAIPTAASLAAVQGLATPATFQTFRLYRGTATPTGASEGDVWIKG